MKSAGPWPLRNRYTLEMSKAAKALKMSKRKDYYKILGVDRNSDEKEITKGYRKMCLKFHPDRHASLSEEEKEEATAKVLLFIVL